LWLYCDDRRLEGGKGRDRPRKTVAMAAPTPRPVNQPVRVFDNADGHLPLAWTAVDGTARYRVQVTPTADDFQALALDTVVTGTDLEARGNDLSEALTPRANGWSWRVRAEHDWGVAE